MELFKPELGLVFWMFVVFAILFFVLAKFAWPVIVNGMEERGAFIDKGVEYTREAQARMEQAKNEAQSILADAHKQQMEIMREADLLKNKIIEEAKGAAAREAQKVIDAATVSIEQSRREAEAQFRKEVSALSLQIVEKLVRKDLSSDTAQAELIDKLISEAKNN